MSPSKKIYGLIGYPVKHSLSPAMHNAAFKEAGIDAEYKLFEVRPEELEDFLINPSAEFKDTEGNSVYAQDVLGFNITIPHKVRAKEILEEKGLSRDEATHGVIKITGAINTVKRETEGVKYWNTDAPGFSRSLKGDLEFEAEGKCALLLGCGGAGRAVVAGLAGAQIKKIYIYESNKVAVQSAQKQFSTVSKIKNKIEFISEEQLEEVINQCKLLVNATPLGMKDNDPSPLDKKLFHEGLYIYDVVYNRNKDTQLIQDAKELNRPYADGLDMLSYQGALAWDIWVDSKLKAKLRIAEIVNIMRQALKEAIRK